MVCAPLNSSYFHHCGRSSSKASQSSLKIILENSSIDNNSLPSSSSQYDKNRSEYEEIADNEYDDVNDSSCSSQRKSEPANRFGTSKSAQGWRKVRAVMAYYYTLRKIKRNGAHYNDIYN